MKTDIRLVFSSQALMFSQSYRRNQNSKMSPESRIATKLKHLKLFLHPLPPSISNVTHYIYIPVCIYMYIFVCTYILCIDKVYDGNENSIQWAIKYLSQFTV